MRQRMRLAAAVLAATTLLLGGCATPPLTHEGEGADIFIESDEALYADGLEQFRAVRAEAAPVQLELHDGEWKVQAYGAAPVAMECASGAPGYRFDLVRAVSDLPFEVAEAPADLAVWLQHEGWKSAGLTGDAGAGKPDAISVVRATGSTDGFIDTLYVSFFAATQSVQVKVESKCFEGDADRLFSLVFPDESSLVVPVYPESERPESEPLFKFSLTDGTAVNELDK